MTARFTKGPGFRATFGKAEFLRSTDYNSESGTLAAATVPTVTIDGFTNQKVAQPGLVLARITGGADAHKVGPFDSGASDGRQTVANIVGILNTFVPWQLMERDVDISFVYDAWVFSDLCYLYTAGVKTTVAAAITATTVAVTDFVVAGDPGIEVRFARRAADSTGTDFGTWPI